MLRVFGDILKPQKANVRAVFSLFFRLRCRLVRVFEKDVRKKSAARHEKVVSQDVQRFLPAMLLLREHVWRDEDDFHLSPCRVSRLLRYVYLLPEKQFFGLENIFPDTLKILTVHHKRDSQFLWRGRRK